MGNNSKAPQENEQRERKTTAADLPRGNETPAIVRRDENKRLRERGTAGREGGEKTEGKKKQNKNTMERERERGF